MRPALQLTIAASLCALQGWAAYPGGYYDLMDGKSREALKAAAKLCVQNHQRLN